MSLPACVYPRGYRSEDTDEMHPSIREECLLPRGDGTLRAVTNGLSECRWSPYQNNGGTILAVAGEDFVTVVGDTRLSLGYSIHTRESSKIAKLTDKCVIATAGMQAEMVTLHRILKVRISLYEHNHRKSPTVGAIAQLLSCLLYSKRFFPFYTFNILAGVDEEGKGAVFAYDAIGSIERLEYSAAGTGGALTMCMLDNQIKKTNQKLPSPTLSKEGTIDLLKDVITSCGERDIYTGDTAEVIVIDGAGITSSTLKLRAD